MKTSAQRRSKRQERRAAEETGGRVQAGSGSSWRAKSDVRKQGDLRIECKTTEKPYYRLNLKDWKKIRLEAIQGGLETPVMQIQFTGYGTSYELAVMDYQLFLYWHGFSENKDIRTWDIACDKILRIDGKNFQGFFANSIYCKTHGVVRAIFSPREGEKHVLAIIEWPLFTRLHEAYTP